MTTTNDGNSSVAESRNLGDQPTQSAGQSSNPNKPISLMVPGLSYVEHRLGLEWWGLAYQSGGQTGARIETPRDMVLCAKAPGEFFEVPQSLIAQPHDQRGSQSPYLDRSFGSDGSQYLRKRLDYTPKQKYFMEEMYKTTPYPKKSQKEFLCVHTGLDLQQVTNWFQNRRNKHKKIQEMLRYSAQYWNPESRMLPSGKM